jgi:hypothetical protein
MSMEKLSAARIRMAAYAFGLAVRSEVKMVVGLGPGHYEMFYLPLMRSCNSDVPCFSQDSCEYDELKQ